MNSQRFSGAQDKISHAWEIFETFSELLKEFDQHPPITLRVNALDAELSEVVVDKFEDWVPPTLKRLAHVAGDALHNARAALDLFAYEISGGGKASFPILLKAEKMRRRVKEALNTTSEVYDAIEKIAPWPGGYDPLGQRLLLLHQLDIADKHHQLTAILMQSSSRSSSFTLPVGPAGLAITHQETDTRALTPGIKLWSGSTSLVPSFLHSGTITAAVHLDDPRIEPVLGHSRAVETLHELINAANETIFTLVSECRGTF
jgi:hypothetical protein